MVRAAAEDLRGPERERVADHLVICSDCATEYRLLRELKPWAEQAATLPAQGQSIRWERLRRFAGITALAKTGYALAVVLFLVCVVCLVWAIATKRENARFAARLDEQRLTRDQTSEALARATRQLEEASRRAELQQQEIAQLRLSVDDLSQPQINIPIVDLETEGIRGLSEGEITTVAVPEGANLFTLVLHILDEPTFPGYAVEVTDERGRRVWRAQGLRRSPADTFTVALPRRLLPAGRYQLGLYGLRAGKNKSLGKYSMRLRYQ